MTEASLIRLLRIAGWTSILSTVVHMVSSYIVRSMQFAKLDLDASFRAETQATFVFGYAIELPVMLASACLCLMAARYLTHNQTTLETIFE